MGMHRIAQVWMKCKNGINVSFLAIESKFISTEFIKQTNLGSHSHKLSFSSLQLDLIQKVGNQKSSLVTKLQDGGAVRVLPKA